MDTLLFKLSELVVEVHELPASREKALVLTKLDEARHWLRDMKEKEHAGSF